MQTVLYLSPRTSTLNSARHFSAQGLNTPMPHCSMPCSSQPGSCCQALSARPGCLFQAELGTKSEPWLPDPASLMCHNFSSSYTLLNGSGVIFIPLPPNSKCTKIS